MVTTHIHLMSPMPRNAVDRDLPAYRGGQFGNGSCAHPGQAPPAGLSQFNPSIHLVVDEDGLNCDSGFAPHSILRRMLRVSIV